jgi:hypothetical protein
VRVRGNERAALVTQPSVSDLTELSGAKLVKKKEAPKPGAAPAGLPPGLDPNGMGAGGDMPDFEGAP